MIAPRTLFFLLVLTSLVERDAVGAFSFSNINHRTGDVGIITNKYSESGFQRGFNANALSMDKIVNCNSNTNRVMSTKLHAETSMDNNDTKEKPYLNLSMVRRLMFTQIVIGSSIWNGGTSAAVLARDFSLDAFPLLLGILGVLPLLYLSRNVENSESPLVATLNLSTDSTMLRLFGSKPQPAVALPVSVVLAALTGLVEEVLFRGQAIPLLSKWSIDNWDLVGSTAILSGTALSTLLFAVLHVNPLGLIDGLAKGKLKEAASDVLVLFAYQICTGSVFAMLFLLSGYNLAVPIVAHALYDFYTFYNTHLKVSEQFEYVENEMLRMPVGNNRIEKKWIRKEGEDFVKGARQIFYLMDKNKDGVISRKELRVGSYSYGFALSKTESEAALQAADIDESGAIDFNEFLEFIEGGSVKKALLGVV